MDPGLPATILTHCTPFLSVLFGNPLPCGILDLPSVPCLDLGVVFTQSKRGIMSASPVCHTRYSRCFTALLVLLFSGFCLAGCASSQSDHGDIRMIPSARGYVLPGDDARAAQFMAGLAQPGSDFGPFSGRSDQKLGLDPFAGEKFEDRYERRILDRQFTSLGRPFNVYQDTTRSLSRVSR